MRVDYFRRLSRTTTTEELGPPPSVWVAVKWRAKRFWKNALKQAIVPMVLLTLAVLFCEWSGMFDHLRGVAAGALSRGMQHTVPKDMLIVEITDDDYKNLFGELSPLHPENVQTLIDSVRQLNPLVIGVDLDTRDVQWECTTLRKYVLGPDPNIIWAQVPVESASADGHPTDETEQEAIEVAPVLGGQLALPERMGVVRFPVDSDGFVRTFQTEYATKKPELPTYSNSDKAGCKSGKPVQPDVPVKIEGSVPSFFYAVARRARADLPEPAKESWTSWFDDQIASLFKPFQKWAGIRFGPKKESPYLKFSGNRYNFQTVQAREFMEPANSAKKASASGKQRVPAVKMKPIDRDKAALLSNRIVLIGGSYGVGRDEYMTPIGRMAGVELLANGVETEIHQGITSIWWPLLVLLDLVVGTVVVGFYYKWHDRPRRAFAWSVVAMSAVVVIGAFSYYGLGAFLNFVPIMAGMVIHQLYHGTKEVAELQKELRERDKEIQELQAKLAQVTGALESAHPKLAVPAAGATEGGSVISKTTVETQTEEFRAESAAGRPHRRGHAAGKSH